MTPQLTSYVGYSFIATQFGQRLHVIRDSLTSNMGNFINIASHSQKPHVIRQSHTYNVRHSASSSHTHTDKQSSKFGVERSLYSLLLLQGKSENREIKGCIPPLYNP
ncbi:hypothetical protein PIB30_083159 [Stylosanthes scabra]|uniref:Uncharacterized protein n=1 Tax=Stylosanthes scabra TaxID=79078 RepID=A0ABU6RSS3_9FABA|nr:hypothetical protein [Stylosanthes scabra]